MLNQLLMWGLFNLLIIGLLFFDLGVFHKKDRVISLAESLVWSGIWIAIALIFGIGVYIWGGHTRGTEFLTCYILERLLSFDNIFVFIVIFSYFKVEAQYHYKILFWGIVGALVSRALFIVSGVALVNKFHWMIYILGAFLVYMGVKLVLNKEEEMNPEENFVIKAFKKFVPITENHGHGKFFVVKNGRLFATSILLVLVVVDTFDIIFAADSIPAALAITSDTFTIYAANAFAILGLRAMYFALEAFMKIFRYLNYGISAVLVFVGFKMLLADYYKISTNASLLIIILVLAVAVVLSIVNKKSSQVMSKDK